MQTRIPASFLAFVPAGQVKPLCRHQGPRLLRLTMPADHHNEQILEISNLSGGPTGALEVEGCAIPVLDGPPRTARGGRL
jgi:hypothetical protein